ncbi:MAG: hypothetical protein ACTSPD_10370 [Promethearchaeota archaeon]
MKQKYKRYMVLKYDYYYPSGGLEDCEVSFESKDKALKYAMKEYFFDCVQVFDRIEGVIIYER